MREKVEKEVLIDVCILGDTPQKDVFSDFLLYFQEGKAPFNWRVILHDEPQAIIQPAIVKRDSPGFAEYIKTPDLVILWFYEASPNSARICLMILKVIRDDLGIPVIVIDPPSKKEDDGEIDPINLDPISWVLHRPIDSDELVKTIKLLLARKEFSDTHRGIRHIPLARNKI